MNDEELDKLFAFGQGRRTDEEWAMFRSYVERWQEAREEKHSRAAADLRKRHEGSGILWQPALRPNRLTPATMSWMEDVAEARLDDHYQERKLARTIESQLRTHIDELGAQLARCGIAVPPAPTIEDSWDDEDAERERVCPRCARTTSYSTTEIGRYLCDSCGLSEREADVTRKGAVAKVAPAQAAASSPSVCPICGTQEYRLASQPPNTWYCLSCNRTCDKAREWVEQHLTALPVDPVKSSHSPRGIAQRLLDALGCGQHPAIQDLLGIAEVVREDLLRHTLTGNAAIDEFVAFVKNWTPDLVVEYTKKPSKVKRPEHFVYNYVIRKAAERLTGGDLHVYPGCLSMEGHLLYDMFLRSVAIMVAQDVYSNEWATENWRKPVAQGIREGG